MSTIQKNKEIIQNLYEQSLNTRRMELLRDVIAEDYIGQSGKKGAAGFEEPVLALFKGFPDIHWKVEELVAEGNKVVVKWKVQGTHTGSFNDFNATGNTVSNDGIGIYEFRNGKIINAQIMTDRLGFLRQLGVPSVAPASPPDKEAHKKQVRFIDKFFIPVAAKKEFYERMNMNRSFIRNLPGFVEDAAYEYTDTNGDLVCLTIALWESSEALNKAREAVQTEYRKQGFDPAEMFERLKIKADRGIYTEVEGY